jgi:hypothetical protein
MKIICRHWLSTAVRCRFSEEEMASVVIIEFLERKDDVNAVASGQLPQSFPEGASQAIVNRMRDAQDHLVRSCWALQVDKRATASTSHPS